MQGSEAGPALVNSGTDGSDVDWEGEWICNPAPTGMASTTHSHSAEAAAQLNPIFSSRADSCLDEFLLCTSPNDVKPETHHSRSSR